MHIICLTPIADGIYNDHKADHITAPPEGWACIPEGFVLPSTFPRLGGLEAEETTYTREVTVDRDGEAVIEEHEYTMMTVTAMTEGTLPEVVESETEPTTEERVTALEEQLAETDEVAIELYEASLAQEAINAEQDEAIIEIYEMMEDMNNG